MRTILVSVVALLVVTTSLAGCGVKRDLERPTAQEKTH